MLGKTAVLPRGIKYNILTFFKVPAEMKARQFNDTSSPLSRDQRDEVTLQVLPLVIENPLFSRRTKNKEVFCASDRAIKENSQDNLECSS